MIELGDVLDWSQDAGRLPNTLRDLYYRFGMNDGLDSFN